jgi:hypothetical protein
LTGLIAGLAATIAIALTLTTSGCGSSSVAVDPVAQAAEATSHAGGAHMALAMQITSAGLPAPVSVSGDGLFNYKTREGTFSLQMSGLPTSARAGAPGPLRIEEIFKSSTLYIGAPICAGQLPGGAHWLKLDLGRVGQSLGFNLEQLSGGQSNPAQFLEYLKASGGAVTPVGHDLIRGVQTTHYAAAVDLSKVADVLPSSHRALLRAALAKAIAQLGANKLPVDVWVDAQGLVRRITIALSFSPGGQAVRMQMTLDLFGFGPTRPVLAPSAGDVYDATQMALRGVAAGGGSQHLQPAGR